MFKKALDQWLEIGIFGIVLVMMSAAPLMTGSVGPTALLTIYILFAVALLFWIARIWLAPDYQLLWNPACWFALAFAGWTFLCYQQADLEYVARKEFLLSWFYAFFFLLMVNNVHRQKWVTLLTVSLLFLAMGISMYGIYQFFAKSDQVWWFQKPQVYVGRASGTYICPNHMAGFLEILAPIGLAYTIAGRFGHVLRILIGYATLVILVGIAMSVSRGAWGATAAVMLGLILFLFRKKGYRWIAVTLSIVGIAGASFFAYKADLSSKRLFDMKREWREIVSGNGPQNIRFRLWEPAYRIWTEPGNFLMGAGPGSFDERFRKYRDPVIQERPRYVHNDYLNFLVDWGLGGGVMGLAWLASLAWLFRGIWSKTLEKSPFENEGQQRSRKRRKQKEGHGNKAPLLLGMGLGIMAISIHSWVDFNLHIPANAILVVAILGVLAGYSRFLGGRFWFRYNIALKVVATIILTLVGVLLVGQQWRFFKEEQLLDRAENLREQPSEYLETLRKAYFVCPTNTETIYAIGDALWFLSQNAMEDQEDYALKSMEWMELGMKLNPFNAYFPIRYGMCLYWLERKKEGDPYFEKALELEPNSYYTTGFEGWRHFQNEDYVEALKWFNRSLELKFAFNKVAFIYHGYTMEKIRELGLEKEAGIQP